MTLIELSTSNFWFSTDLLDSLHRLDTHFYPVLQSISVLCHYLGGTTFFLLLISTTYAFFRPKLAFELSLGLLTSGIIISLAKFYLESPRPFPYPPSFGEKAFGLPSGHVYSAIVVWGLLAYRIRPLWFRILCFLVIFLTPFSRMYLRVHFVGDVTLGFIMGTIHLLLIILLLRRLDSKTLKHYFFKTDQHRTLALLGIVTTFSIVLLDSLTLSSEHFHSLSTAMTSAGSLAGFWMGLLFYPRLSKSHFLDWGFPRQKGKVDFQAICVRTVILLFILTLFYVLPSSLIQNTSWKDDLFLRYFRYFLISFCLVFLYPITMQNIAKGKYFLKEKHDEN